jgi:hypothetical protein
MNALKEDLLSSAGCGISRGAQPRGSIGSCWYDPRFANDTTPTDNEHEPEVRAGTSQSNHGRDPLPERSEGVFRLNR